MIPTPSHPINKRNMLFAMVRVNMAMRKMSRRVKNFVVSGSEAMYHVANSRNIMEYRSVFREIGILKFWVGCHSQ